MSWRTMIVKMDSYFNGKWSDSSFDSYKWSGYRLIEEINSQNPESVLDVGCGFNRLQGKIKNLIGIDPYNDYADMKISLEEYQGDPVDVVLCLGSINFGDEDTIDSQMEVLDSIWKKRAYFRVNPGLEHTWNDKKDWKGIVWYQWNAHKIYKICDKYNYTLGRLEEEYTTQGHLRYYFELYK